MNIETYKDLSSVPMKKYKMLIKLMTECFPDVFADEDEINLILRKNKVDLALDDKKLIGFISYEESGKDIIDIDYLGVIQNKEYLNKGTASEMIAHLAETHEGKDIILCCKASNDRARYLYHKLGFEICGEGDNSFYGKMYRLTLNTSKRYRDISSVIYQLYKENKSRKNENFEDTLIDMYKNKLYDNIYQYNMDDKDIDKVIMNSSLFAKCLCILEEALNDGVKEEELFNKIESNIGLELYNDVHVYKTLFDVDKKDIEDIYKIFKLIRIKSIDDNMSKSIKVRR